MLRRLLTTPIQQHLDLPRHPHQPLPHTNLLRVPEMHLQPLPTSHITQHQPHQHPPLTIHHNLPAAIRHRHRKQHHTITRLHRPCPIRRIRQRNQTQQHLRQQPIINPHSQNLLHIHRTVPSSKKPLRQQIMHHQRITISIQISHRPIQKPRRHHQPRRPPPIQPHITIQPVLPLRRRHPHISIPIHRPNPRRTRRNLTIQRQILLPRHRSTLRHIQPSSTPELTTPRHPPKHHNHTHQQHQPPQQPTRHTFFTNHLPPFHFTP